MKGQDVTSWLDYKYQGDIDDIDYKEVFSKVLRAEKRYDYALEREWNNLYPYED